MIRILLIFLSATDLIMGEFNEFVKYFFLSFDVGLMSSFHYVIDSRKFDLILLMQLNARPNKFTFCATSRSFHCASVSCFLCGMSLSSQKDLVPQSHCCLIQHSVNKKKNANAFVKVFRKIRVVNLCKNMRRVFVVCRLEITLPAIGC